MPIALLKVYQMIISFLQNLQLDPDQQFCYNEWSKRNEFSLYKFIEAFRECFTTSKLFLIRLGNITYTRNKTHKLTQHF